MSRRLASEAFLTTLHRISPLKETVLSLATISLSDSQIGLQTVSHYSASTIGFREITAPHNRLLYFTNHGVYKIQVPWQSMLT